MTEDLLALARLAGRGGLHPRGDGEHGRLLEADLEPAGGRRSSCCWSTPGTSRRCPAARPTSSDCEWIADLLRHGLLQRQLRPRPAAAGAAGADPLPHLAWCGSARPRPTGCRRRWKGANIKLAAVATDILGKSGREMLAALVGGHDRRGGAGRAGPGAAAREAPGAGAGAGRARRRPPALPGRPAAGPRRLPRRGDRPGERRDRRAPAPGRGRRSPGWTRSRASAATWPRRWWPRSAPT